MTDSCCAESVASKASEQATLSGGEASGDYTRPDTLRFCWECDEYFLRSQWREHDAHDRVEPQTNSNSTASNLTDDDDDDDEDEVWEIGGVYTIRLSYSVDYSFRVPGYDENDAERRAKDMVWDYKPNDMMHMHTNTRKLTPIYEDDDEWVEELEEGSGY